MSANVLDLKNITKKFGYINETNEIKLFFKKGGKMRRDRTVMDVYWKWWTLG